MSQSKENSEILDKKFEERDFVSPNISEKMPIINTEKKTKIAEFYEITLEQLENLISSYSDTNNKTTVLENVELLGGTKGILQKLKTSA